VKKQYDEEVALHRQKAEDLDRQLQELKQREEAAV
jgi:hypothetical protein